MVGSPRFSIFSIINGLLLIGVGIATLYPVLYITVVSLSETSFVVQGKVWL